MAKCDAQNRHPREWRVLYRAAIFEHDTCEISKRLSDAELAIIERARELLQEKGSAVEGEREVLDDAMYALRVTLENDTRAA